MTNGEQLSATALKNHSRHQFPQKPTCWKMMRGKNRLGQDYKLFLPTGYCNVSACVWQNKGIITNQHIASATPNFLQLKHD